MKKVKLPNGMWKLTAKSGIVDTRTGRQYSEVVCKETDIKYFREIKKTKGKKS